MPLERNGAMDSLGILCDRCAELTLGTALVLGLDDGEIVRFLSFDEAALQWDERGLCRAFHDVLLRIRRVDVRQRALPDIRVGGPAERGVRNGSRVNPQSSNGTRPLR